MATIRCVLAVAAGGAFGVAVAFLILGLGHLQAGIAVAAGGACLVVLDCLRWVQERRWIAGRDAVWARREVEEILRGTNWGGR